MLPPLIAIAGGSGGPLERERLAKAPKLGDGWKAFDETTDYVTQRLPFRAELVDANTWIANNIWGRAPDYGRGGPARALPFESVRTDPGGGYNQNGGAAKTNPVVSTGPNGWLFLQGEFDTLCHPPVGFKTALARWEQLIQEIRASGRKVVLLVVPEKSTVYPEQVESEGHRMALRSAQQDAVLGRAPVAARPGSRAAAPAAARPEAQRSEPPRSTCAELALESRRGDPAPQDGAPSAGGTRSGPPAGRATADEELPERPRRASPAAPRPVTEPSSGRSRGRATGSCAPSPSRAARRSSRRAAPEPCCRDAPCSCTTPLATWRSRCSPTTPRGSTITQWVTSSQAQIRRLIRGSNTVIIETVERDFLNRAAVGQEGAVRDPRFPALAAGEAGAAAALSRAKSRHPDSNRGPHLYERCALPAELWRRVGAQR